MTNEWRFIEVGRVVLFTKGRFSGKLGVVVDVVDHNRVLVQMPKVAGHEKWTGVPRHVATLRDLEPTPCKADIRRMQREGKLLKALEEPLTQWEGTSWAQKLKIREARANIDDITRFRIRQARRARNYKLRTAYQEKLQKAGLKEKAKKAVSVKLADKERKNAAAAAGAKKRAK
eukprot:TRINITY_DN2961_c0_g1_i7.p2 TRINITY_DN2961_c0_g1~~TRINITY_DN2961_c0_g1_i7.p2  ORF type:complete len:174 (+),score=83.06 TRINITY_DN2961_c0_g1_i7:77-598(+)